MQLINGALVLNVTLLFLFASIGSVKVISQSNTTMHASLKSHKSAHNIGVLILVSLLTS